MDAYFPRFIARLAVNTLGLIFAITASAAETPPIFGDHPHWPQTYKAPPESSIDTQTLERIPADQLPRLIPDGNLTLFTKSLEIQIAKCRTLNPNTFWNFLFRLNR